MSCQKIVVLVLVAFTFLNVFQVTMGLRCYSCHWMNGRGDRECLNNPPPSRFLVECSQPQCWKKYSHVNGMTNVQRFCVAVAGDSNFCQPSTFDDLMTGQVYPATECFCKTEGCNGSSRKQAFGIQNDFVVGTLIIIGLMVTFVS